MNLVGLAAVTALLISYPLQEQENGQVNTVGLLCGKLVYTEFIPEKGSIRSFQARTKAIPKTAMQLYPRLLNVDCCDGLTPVAETVTGHRGVFKFKESKPGDYWVVAHISGREYKTPIRYQPSKRTDDSCSGLIYSLEDSGRFGVERIITVD
jgi:hypothetical protein